MKMVILHENINIYSTPVININIYSHKTQNQNQIKIYANINKQNSGVSFSDKMLWCTQNTKKQINDDLFRIYLHIYYSMTEIETSSLAFRSHFLSQPYISPQQELSVERVRKDGEQDAVYGGVGGYAFKGLFINYKIYTKYHSITTKFNSLRYVPEKVLKVSIKIIIRKIGFKFLL